MSRTPIPPLPFKLPRMTSQEWRELKRDPLVQLRRSWRNPSGMVLRFRREYVGTEGVKVLMAIVTHEGVAYRYRVPGVKPLDPDEFDWGD